MDASRELTPRGFGSSGDSILLSDDWESFDFNIDHILGRYLTSVRSAHRSVRKVRGARGARGAVRGAKVRQVRGASSEHRT